MRWRLAPWLLGSMLLALGCTETAGPPPTSAPAELPRAAVRPPALRWSGGPPALTATLEVEQDSLAETLGLVSQAAPLAQSLETYLAGFWVPNWRPSTLQISYADNGGWPRRPGSPFLQMIVPRGALYQWPDGRPIGRWGLVPIVVAVDSQEVLVHFAPSGLQFTPACPVLLQIWYGRALGDSVSGADRTKLKLWHREPGGDWTVLPAENSPGEGWFRAKICGFSSYQISY